MTTDLRRACERVLAESETVYRWGRVPAALAEDLPISGDALALVYRLMGTA